MQLLKPLALSLGDTIGVIAPSFPLLPAWRPDYERGKEMLRTLGFAIKEGRTMGLTRYWAAGTPQDQADDINAMFADPEVKAIIAHAGGFPGMSVLDRIAGMLIGKLTWINDNFEGIEYPTVRQVVLDVVGDYGFPIMANVDFGHHIANLPLPIGVEAMFDAEAASLALAEAPVKRATIRR